MRQSASFSTSNHAKARTRENGPRSFAAFTELSRIATTSGAIDSKSRALLVELVADNDEGLLKPGGFAEVTFALPPRPDALSVPASALLFRD